MAQGRLEVINRHLDKSSSKFASRDQEFKYTRNIGGELVFLSMLQQQLHSHSALQDPDVKFSDKEFNYTVNNSFLSRSDQIFYERNGFLIVPNLFDEQLLDDCCERFAALCEGRVPKGNITLMKDLSLMKTGAKGQYLYNKAQDILYDPVFEKYFFNEKLLSVVECFTGPNIMGVHSMLINKPPDSGALTSRHPLHQDLYYFPFRPADRIVAAWTALEDVTTSNGCLLVIPGSHRGTLLPHAYPTWEGGVNKMYHGVKGYNPSHLMPVPMPKGHTIFFHPLLLHGSGSNSTKGFRRSISCHYAASECYYIDVQGTLQEGIGKEVEEIVKKRGFDFDFKMVWKLRSRLIQGLAVNL